MRGFGRSRTRRRTLTAAFAAAALAMAFLPQAASASASASTGASTGASTASGPVSDPAALVNPLIGTGSGGAVVGQVDTFPGAVVPFGMVQWSPDTSSRPPGGGYDYADSATTGLSLTHLSGPGCAVAGDFPVLPLVGAVPADPSSAQQPFSHASESATPGAYSVTLAPGTAGAVGVQLAATARTGLAQFTFPATDQARVLVKSAGSAAGSSSATFAVSGDRQISGSVTSGHFCGQPNSYTVYFAARFDRPFTSSASWAGGTGGTLTFDTRGTGGTRGNSTVRMQVGISYTSVDGARRNLAAEATSWSTNDVARAAHNAWNQQLRKIEIAGGTPAQQASSTPRSTTRCSPERHRRRRRPLPRASTARSMSPRPGQHQYSNFSGWDVYRSEMQLLAMSLRAARPDMASSLLDDADQGGWLPKWPSVNGYTGVMNGDAADPMLADPYAFGARDFDAQGRLAAMVKGATSADRGQLGQGWYEERPHSAAYSPTATCRTRRGLDQSRCRTGRRRPLEYATADFAIARLRQALGDNADRREFLKRSQNWTNVFNTATGYLQPRDANGAFPAGDPATAGHRQLRPVRVPGGQRGAVHVDGAAEPARPVRRHGRRRRGAATAGHLLHRSSTPARTSPTTGQGNEPAVGTPWVYDSAGAPWKTQRVVRQIVSTLYSPTPGGEPGNDDLGAMSSWYVWATLGLYPQTPGVPMLALGAPLFTSAVVHAGANTLTIKAPKAGDAAPYIQCCGWTGRRPSTRM